MRIVSPQLVYDYQEINMASIIISAIALIVSVIALIYTAETYWLKTGARIRGACDICSSVACEDMYVSKITLENSKDRAIAIYKIYLRFGHNIYVKLDDFESAPLILDPFEVFRKEYDPIDFYDTGTTRVKINHLFDDKSVRLKIILSTSEGKFIINSCYAPE